MQLLLVSFSVVVLLLLQGFKVDVVHKLLEEIRVLVCQFDIGFKVCGSVHLQSLKSNTQLDATINRKIYCYVVQTLLNMFRALQCPSSGARQTAVAASGFRMNVEVEVFSAAVGL